MRLTALAIGALLFFTSPAPAQEESALFGQRIVSIAFTSDGPTEREVLERLIELRAGDPLTDESTAATIRNLYATGDFQDILIDAVPAADGVAVTLHLFRSFRVQPIRFDDGVSLSREQMRRAIPFAEGSVFSPEALEEGAEALKRRAAAEGYVRAEVFPEVVFDREKFQAEVLYRIESGEAARVASALFDGETAPFTPEQLLRKARLDPGDRYRETRAVKDAERMTELLHDKGRLQGIVELIAAQPTDDGRVMPVYRISVGPEVVFETRGVREKKVRREIRAAIEGQGFSEDIVLQYVEEKKRDLQRKGYYRASVEYEVVEVPGKTTVTLTVVEGEKFAIEEIQIAGNESVEEETLRDLMVTREKGLPLIRPGRLVEEVIQEDASAILGYYQTHGWVSADVERPQITAGSKPDRLIVSIAVVEGPQTIVASRKVLGADHADVEEIEKLFQVKPGEPFNPNEVRYDAYALQGYYRDSGFPEASVDDAWTLSPDKTSAEVVYRVEEGFRSFFGKTIVRGNTVTDTDRILQLITWEEGDAFSESEVLVTQRNLTRTGVFQRVEIQPQVTDLTDSERNMEIEVREGRSHSLLYGVGYQYAPDAGANQSDPYVVLGATHNNLFGTMRSAGFELQLRQSAFEDLFRGNLFGQEGTGRGRVQLSFRDPFLLGKDIPLSVFLFASREPIQEIDIERLGFITEVSRFYGPYLRAGLRYEYQRITPVNPQDLSDIEREFRRFDQPIEQSTIGPTAFYDRRDDIIDPHKGYYLSTAAKYAFPFLSAEARYTKVSGQGAYFHPLGGSVLAASVRGGGIFPYGPSDIAVPIAERFFAGGPSTNRGFDNDIQGVPGVTVDYNTRAIPNAGGIGSCAERFPDDPNVAAYDCNAGPRIVGGNGFLALNAELRFPIFASVGGTIFYDASQVWGEFSDIRFSLEGEEGLRQGVGFELRYMSPIGPIRVGYGVPLERREFVFDVTTTILDENGDPQTVVLRRGLDKTKEKTGGFYFSIGYPF